MSKTILKSTKNLRIVQYAGGVIESQSFMGAVVVDTQRTSALTSPTGWVSLSINNGTDGVMLVLPPEHARALVAQMQAAFVD